jgi:hypothetical protein
MCLTAKAAFLGQTVSTNIRRLPYGCAGGAVRRSANMKRMQTSMLDSHSVISPDEDKILSLTVLSRRWGCTLQTAKKRVKHLRIPLIAFTKRANGPQGVMLSAVLRAEQAASRVLKEEDPTEA